MAAFNCADRQVVATVYDGNHQAAAFMDAAHLVLSAIPILSGVRFIGIGTLHAALFILRHGLALRIGTRRPVWVFERKLRQGDVPGFREESPMIATRLTCPKGPALLAKAGVTLSEAQWLYRQPRGGAAAADTDRVGAIRRKVSSFVAANVAPARGRLAFA